MAFYELEAEMRKERERTETLEADALEGAEEIRAKFRGS